MNRLWKPKIYTLRVREVYSLTSRRSTSIIDIVSVGLCCLGYTKYQSMYKCMCMLVKFHRLIWWTCIRCVCVCVESNYILGNQSFKELEINLRVSFTGIIFLAGKSQSKPSRRSVIYDECWNVYDGSYTTRRFWRNDSWSINLRQRFSRTTSRWPTPGDPDKRISRAPGS